MGEHIQGGGSVTTRLLADSAQRLAETASAFVRFRVGSLFSEKPNDPQDKPAGLWEGERFRSFGSLSRAVCIRTRGRERRAGGQKNIGQKSVPSHSRRRIETA